MLPARYMRLESEPISAIDDNPLFCTGGASRILGVSEDCLKKWRQRDQGPDYIQYGENGPVRYPLNELMAYRAAHTVRPSRKRQK